MLQSYSLHISKVGKSYYTEDSYYRAVFWTPLMFYFLFGGIFLPNQIAWLRL